MGVVLMVFGGAVTRSAKVREVGDSGKKGWGRMQPGRHASPTTQAGCNHALTDAHGHNDVLGPTPFPFQEDVSNLARAGHAEGMSDGDAAAVDIHLGVVDTQHVGATQRHLRWWPRLLVVKVG